MCLVALSYNHWFCSIQGAYSSKVSYPSHEEILSHFQCVANFFSKTFVILTNPLIPSLPVWKIKNKNGNKNKTLSIFYWKGLHVLHVKPRLNLAGIVILVKSFINYQRERDRERSSLFIYFPKTFKENRSLKLMWGTGTQSLVPSSTCTGILFPTFY